jgi:hypothetical protein
MDVSENAACAIGVFWTNENCLRRYWLNRFLMLNPNLSEDTIFTMEFNSNGEPVYEIVDAAASTYITDNISQMRNSPEKFITFDKSYFGNEHSFGKIKAENPDLSFKEAAQAHFSKQQAEAEI